jgi:hypothetical protein
MGLSFYNSLKKLKDPVKEIKANEQYAVFAILCKLAYRIGVSWIDRRLRAIGLRPYTCRRMDWGESIVGIRSLNAVEAINDYLHFNLFVVRASTMPSAKFAYDKPSSGRCEDETKKGIYRDEGYVSEALISNLITS